MSTQEFKRPLDSPRYRWLPQLIILMNLVALVSGVFLMRNVEHRLIAAAGEELTIAAAEVSDKLDRLLFERYGDVHMMARAFALRSSDTRYLSSYLGWVKTNYFPVYLWLGVTDGQGAMVASTEPSFQGRDYSRADWFQRVKTTRKIHVDDVAIHDNESGIHTVAFSMPILDSEGTFLGVVTTRMAASVLEDVTTRTVRSLEGRQEFTGPVAYQMVTKDRHIFVDSILPLKGPLETLPEELPSVQAMRSGEPGFVEEEYRDVLVVTGHASTKGFGEYPGLGWHVLVRMDRARILYPISSILWKVGVTGAIVWVPMMVLLLWATSKLRAEYQQAQQESSWARAAEAALLQSQERNRAIVETALDGLVTIDASGVVTDWNGQAAAIFGWPREEAFGKRLADMIIPLRDREAHERGLRHFLASGETHILNRRIEVLALHRDGHEFPVELAISPVRTGDSIFFSAFVRDITERRASEVMLRRSELRYRSVVNALDEGVVVIDAEGMLRTGNASAERILGLSLEEINGRSLRDARWQAIREDGSPFPQDEYPAAITLRTGQPCANVVMGLYRPDGELRWIDINSRPLADEGQQTPASVVMSFSDITDRKRAEERLTAQYAVTRVLAEARTLEEAVPKLIQAMGQNLEWDCGIFWRVDKAAGLLRCVDQWHDTHLKASAFLTATWEWTFKPGEGLPGRIWAGGKATWITDVVHDGNFPRQR